MKFSETVEETSSSSENSPSNVSRKHKPTYPTRKSAKATAMMKRHVRSSSGYSSHNEETTFRYDTSHLIIIRAHNKKISL